MVVLNARTASAVAVMVGVGLASMSPAYAGGLFDKPFDRGGALSIDKPFSKGGSLSIDKPFDKGGSLSIDKPFSKGGSLSIDKPFDFVGDPLSKFERSANDLLHKAMDAVAALAQKIVFWFGIGLAAVFGFAIALAVGLTALVVRRTQPEAITNSSIRQL